MERGQPCPRGVLAKLLTTRGHGCPRSFREILEPAVSVLLVPILLLEPTVETAGYCRSSLRDCHIVPSTIWISSSVNSYRSWTTRSICASVTLTGSREGEVRRGGKGIFRRGTSRWARPR